jgi:hypothetical protein
VVRPPRDDNLAVLRLRAHEPREQHRRRVEAAAGTTLQNCDGFLSNLATIGGGVLNGHVDANNIIWIGHSRGGEGVVIAYDRIFNRHVRSGELTMRVEDIKLVSSIAPVDFQTLPHTNPHSCELPPVDRRGRTTTSTAARTCNLCQTFHLHDRALQYRQSISLHGVGHGDFHNGGGSSVATGPLPRGRPDTHKIMKGYLFPLVERYIDGNIPAQDYLTRACGSRSTRPGRRSRTPA